MSTSSDRATGPPAGRRDAWANRERVLAAAAAAVHREGPRVPLARIAEEAGVGVATLYRNYPSRETLLVALAERSYRWMLDDALQAADWATPAIDAISGLLDRLVERREELFLPVVVPMPGDVHAGELLARLQQAVDRLVARGRDDGSVRDDVTGRDLLVAGALLVQGLPHVPDWDRSARRHAAILVDGFSPATAHHLLRNGAR